MIGEKKKKRYKGLRKKCQYYSETLMQHINLVILYWFTSYSVADTNSKQKLCVFLFRQFQCPRNTNLYKFNFLNERVHPSLNPIAILVKRLSVIESICLNVLTYLDTWQ